jgi:hypothetical protein
VSELNSKPFRVRTDPGKVGQPKFSLNSTVPVYLVTGDIRSDLVSDAYLNVAGVPTVNLVPGPVVPLR